MIKIIKLYNTYKLTVIKSSALKGLLITGCQSDNQIIYLTICSRPYFETAVYIKLNSLFEIIKLICRVVINRIEDKFRFIITMYIAKTSLVTKIIYRFAKICICVLGELSVHGKYRPIYQNRKWFVIQATKYHWSRYINSACLLNI